MSCKCYIYEKDIPRLAKLFERIMIPYTMVNSDYTRFTKILYTNIFRASEKMKNAFNEDHFNNNRDFEYALCRANLNYAFSEKFELNEADLGYWDEDFIKFWIKCYNDFKNLVIEKENHSNHHSHHHHSKPDSDSNSEIKNEEINNEDENKNDENEEVTEEIIEQFFLI